MAAAPSSLGTQIREELSCGICLELFTRPKVLPCQHTFCQDCLQNHAGRGGAFQCPNCRQQVRLPPQGVTSLPDNCIVANMCERLQNQTILTVETREQPQPEDLCSFHPSEVLKVYCKQCQVPVCEQCLDKTHDGHGTSTINKAAQEKRLALQTLINEGRNILESSSSFIQGLRETEKTLNEYKQWTDNRNTKNYETLMTKVEQNYQKNIDRVHTEMERFDKLSAACDQAEQKMEQGGVRLLGQETTLEEVVKEYRGKATPTLAQTQPVVFQPRDNSAQALGYVTDQSPPSAPTSSPNVATGGTGHHGGNQRQEQLQLQRVTFGEAGPGIGQFYGPFGVTVSNEGEIFVADCNNRRIQVFNLQGTFIRMFPTVVSGEELMPSDVAMDTYLWINEPTLWVVGRAGSIHVELEFAVHYTKQGLVLRKIDLYNTEYRRNVAVDTRINQYSLMITQTTCAEDIDDENVEPQGQVLVFSGGKLVRVMGQQQGMKRPTSIIVNNEGNILVLDNGNNCVYVYKEDGQFLFQFGDEGSGEGQLKNSCGICTDRIGNIIVADTGNNRVEMFDKTGKFLKHIATDLKGPCAVGMATGGQLVVTEALHTLHTLHPFLRKHTVSRVTIFSNF